MGELDILNFMPENIKIGSPDARNIIAMLAIHYRDLKRKMYRVKVPKKTWYCYQNYIKAKQLLGNTNES
jgi:hypothetical protein